MATPRDPKLDRFVAQDGDFQIVPPQGDDPTRAEMERWQPTRPADAAEYLDREDPKYEGRE